MAFLPPQPPDLDRPEAVAPPAPRWQPPASATAAVGLGANVPAVPGTTTNKHAVWGLMLAISGLGLLFFTGGVAAPISLPASIAGWVLGVKGKRRVDRGEPVGDRPTAVAAQVTGIVGVVLGVLALIAWALLLALGSAVDLLDLEVPRDDGPGGRLD